MSQEINIVIILSGRATTPTQAAFQPMRLREFFNMTESHRKKGGRSKDAPLPFESKEVTLRVQQIRLDTTVEALQGDFKTIGRRLYPGLQSILKGAQVRSLCRRDREFCTATIVLTISVPLGELLQALERATTAAGLELEFDSSFGGITPLWEDPSGANCE